MSDLNRDRVEEIIGRKLYPPERFPRSLFPDLVPTLTSLFIKNIADLRTDDLEQAIRSETSLKSLLFNDTGTLVVIYKDLIFKYIFKRHLNKDEVEEIVQEIITRLLNEKINGIRKRFNFEDPELPTFTSYFLVTIRNIYIDIMRKESRGRNLVENDNEIERIRDTRRRDMLSALILEEEFKKFNALLKMYHKTAPKLNLTLKFKFNIPIDESDILSCFPDCSEKDRNLMMNQGKFKIRNKKNMENIAPVFNKYEGKSNNPDTLRKWISTKLEELKRQMNHVHPEKPYNNSTISDLIILYFKWKRGQGV